MITDIVKEDKPVVKERDVPVVRQGRDMYEVLGERDDRVVIMVNPFTGQWFGWVL